MRKACALYPPARVVAYVRDGLDSKNNRTRVSCAEEIGCTIEREGAKMYQGGCACCFSCIGCRVSYLAGILSEITEMTSVLHWIWYRTLHHWPHKRQQIRNECRGGAAGAKCDVVPALGRLVSDRDKDIRAACLAALEIVYSYEGEGEVSASTTSSLSS